jgi:hypothetical protein
MKIIEYPKEIERAALDLAATCEELSETRDRIKDAEIEALPAVMTARTEDGKLIHTNDKARGIAFHFILRADSSSCLDCALIRQLEHKRAIIEAESERLRREYRISLIDYERAQLGQRSAA